MSDRLGLPWTPEEDATLLAHDTTTPELCAKLRRTKRGILNRRAMLNRPNKKLDIDAGFKAVQTNIEQMTSAMEEKERDIAKRQAALDAERQELDAGRCRLAALTLPKE